MRGPRAGAVGVFLALVLAVLAEHARALSSARSLRLRERSSDDEMHAFKITDGRRSVGSADEGSDAIDDDDDDTLDDISSDLVRKPCNEYEGCNECTRAGCFWQNEGRTQGGCNEDCFIMDVPCFGKTDNWKANCPLPGTNPSQTSLSDKSVSADNSFFLIDDDQDCCDEEPVCPPHLQSSTTRPCTQDEFKMNMCIIERHCCNQIFCRVRENFQEEIEEEVSSYRVIIFVLASLSLAGYVLSRRTGK